uniref:Uncharacterized protein n=1 Tax=Picea sitchensis TaxID=3332 RepID=D5A8Z2_PICSI|nr:unknown [Picea sitchensis]
MQRRLRKYTQSQVHTQYRKIRGSAKLGVFEDSNQAKLDHQASNSNPLQPLEDLMKIWRFTQVSWMEINHEREICERICRDIT